LRIGREPGARVRLDGKPAAMVPRIITSGTGARVMYATSPGDFLLAACLAFEIAFARRQTLT
jgi:hypothetical protein